MPIELRVALAFSLALAGALALMPVAIRIARRLGLVDRPAGWKVHSVSTPYTGGIAVVLAASAAAVAGSEHRDVIAPALAAAGGLLVIGLFDDWRRLGATPRVLASTLAGAVLWWSDLGWSPTGTGWADLALTIAVVVVIVNAINLIDLMDGIAATLGGVGALGAGVLAARAGDGTTAVLAFGLAGGCAGFLPFNLIRPARAFLGDCGTMPAGFLLAAVSMQAASGAEAASEIPTAFLFAAVPLTDMAYRVAHRLRRRVPLMMAGRDSLMTRLDDVLGSPRLVCLLAGVVQASVCTAAVVAVPESAAATLAVAGFAAALMALLAQGVRVVADQTLAGRELVVGLAAALAIAAAQLGLVASVAENQKLVPGAVADSVTKTLDEVAPDYALIVDGPPICKPPGGHQQVCRFPLSTSRGRSGEGRYSVISRTGGCWEASSLPSPFGEYLPVYLRGCVEGGDPAGAGAGNG